MQRLIHHTLPAKIAMEALGILQVPAMQLCAVPSQILVQRQFLVSLGVRNRGALHDSRVVIPAATVWAIHMLLQITITLTYRLTSVCAYQQTMYIAEDDCKQILIHGDR